MSSTDDLLRKARAQRSLPAPEVRRALRRSVGLSQDDFAGVLGVHRETVSRWERGERTPRGDDLVAYVDLLDRVKALS